MSEYGRHRHVLPLYVFSSEAPSIADPQGQGHGQSAVDVEH